MSGLKSPAEVAAYLGVPLRTCYAWQSRGTGPRFMKVGRHVRYRMADVDLWLARQASQAA